jgi:hypothetical protein
VCHKKGLRMNRMNGHEANGSYIFTCSGSNLGRLGSTTVAKIFDLKTSYLSFAIKEGYY